MKIDDIPILKQDERGVMYNCGPVRYIVHKEGSVAGDHKHTEEEIIFLLNGKIELTIGEQKQQITAPKTFTLPANIYHKVFALTDIEFIEKRSI